MEDEIRLPSGVVVRESRFCWEDPAVGEVADAETLGKIVDALQAALDEVLDNYANLIDGEFGEFAQEAVPDHLAAIAGFRSMFLGATPSPASDPASARSPTRDR